MEEPMREPVVDVANQSFGSVAIECGLEIAKILSVCLCIGAALYGLYSCAHFVMPFVNGAIVSILDLVLGGEIALLRVMIISGTCAVVGAWCLCVLRKLTKAHSAAGKLSTLYALVLALDLIVLLSGSLSNLSGTQREIGLMPVLYLINGLAFASLAMSFYEYLRYE